MGRVRIVKRTVVNDKYGQSCDRMRPIAGGKENEDLPKFEDEQYLMQASAAENYFNQGKAVTINARRKGRKKATEPDANISDENMEEEDSTSNARFTQCQLPEVKKYIEDAPAILKKISKCPLDLPGVEDFRRLRIFMCCGYNVLIHGVGSKHSVLNAFRKQFNGHATISVDGFHENASVRDLLKLIGEKMLPKQKFSANERRNAVNFASIISQKLLEEQRQLTIFIHSIDGPHLRDTSSQETLLALTSTGRVRICASIDHVNSTIMWNSDQMTSFKWVHFRADTFEINVDELCAGQSLLLGLNPKSQQVAHTTSSLDALWQSFPENSKKIFRLLASMFFAGSTEKNHSIPFWDLFQEAKDRFYVSADAALRQQLVEFEDHRIISKRRNNDGNEHLCVTVPKSLIEQFLTEKGMPLEISG